jgi:hypothetical protein
LGQLFEDGDAFGDRRVGIEESVDGTFVMLQRIVDTHRRRRMIGTVQRPVVGLQGA